MPFVACAVKLLLKLVGTRNKMITLWLVMHAIRGAMMPLPLNIYICKSWFALVINPCVVTSAFSRRINALNRHKHIYAHWKPFVSDVLARALSQVVIFSKGFITGSHHKAHKPIHTDEKAILCGVCCKSFKSQVSWPVTLNNKLHCVGVWHVLSGMS